MRTFEEVLTHFHSFLESATYLDVVPCRWGYVRLFNEGNPINFNAILCRTPQELYTALENDLETEIQVSLGIDRIGIKLVCFWVRFGIVTLKNMLYCTTSKTFSRIFNFTVKLCQMLCQCAGRVH